MKKCKNCQKEFADEFSFCPYCGCKMEENDKLGLLTFSVIIILFIKKPLIIIDFSEGVR